VTADPFAGLRAMLMAELRFRVESVSETHGELLRRHVARLDGEHPEVDISSALLCLLTAEALGAPPEDALPAATSLALMSLMADVMAGLSREERGSLWREWGMPRALNAGDAFYALAQDTLLRSPAFAADPDRGLEAMNQLDLAARAHSEALYAPGADGAGPRAMVLSCAAALGALSVNAQPLAIELVADIAALRDASADDGERARNAGVSTEALAKLRAAAKFIAEAGA
jgi:hypothetical protein